MQVVLSLQISIN